MASASVTSVAAAALVFLAGGVTVYFTTAVRRRASKTIRSAGIAVVAVVAVALGCAVSYFLWGANTEDHREAVRTGAIVAGATGALYSLWISERRRGIEERRQSVEQDRHTLEQERTQLDGYRVATERFAKAIELLGHDTPQVRVAAMHSLVELSRSREEMLQATTSVICAYLRRPFAPPLKESGDSVYDEALTSDQREELTVRRAAQRLLNQSLPTAPAGTPLDVDLTGATVDRLDFTNKHFGQLLCHDMTVLGAVNLSGAIVESTASFSRSRFLGDFVAKGTDFKGDAWFASVQFVSKLTIDEARVAGELTFTRSTYRGRVSLQKMTCEGYFGMAHTEAARGVILDETRLMGHVDFRSARIRRRTALNSVTVDGPSLDMRKAECQHFEFRNIAINGACSLKPPNGWRSGDAPDRAFLRTNEIPDR